MNTRLPANASTLSLSDFVKEGWRQGAGAAAAPAHRTVHVELAGASTRVGAHHVVLPVGNLLHNEAQLLIQLLSLQGWR